MNENDEAKMVLVPKNSFIFSIFEQWTTHTHTRTFHNHYTHTHTNIPHRLNTKLGHFLIAIAFYSISTLNRVYIREANE